MKAVAALALTLTLQQQCDIGAAVQGKTAEAVRTYFPEAEVMNVLPCVLSVETHVEHVSKQLLVEMAQRIFSSKQTVGDLVLGMNVAGYNYFILGFTNHTIVFDKFRGTYYVFDAYETARFFQSAPNVCLQIRD